MNNCYIPSLYGAYYPMCLILMTLFSFLYMWTSLWLRRQPLPGSPALPPLSCLRCPAWTWGDHSRISCCFGHWAHSPALTDVYGDGDGPMSLGPSLSTMPYLGCPEPPVWAPDGSTYLPCMVCWPGMMVQMLACFALNALFVLVPWIPPPG